MLQKLLLTSSILLLLISCDTPPTVQVAPVDIPIKKVSRPEALNLKPITWKIITLDGVVYYAIRISDYEQLAINMEDLKRYIKAQQNIINYYESNL